MFTDTQIIEERLATPVIHECDLCIIGGSCTGLFAAIRAARLGLKVAIVEQQNCFGGIATSALVNVWHSLLDTEFKQTIIGGLTAEVMTRLQKRNAVRVVERNPGNGFIFNSEELKIELDEIAKEHGLKVYFHTQFVAPWVQDGVLKAVIVENKSGRGAIQARFFIDASGDGDLATRLGLETYFPDHGQPATACAKVSGWNTLPADFGEIARAFLDHAAEYDLPAGYLWGATVPSSDIFMLAASRVPHLNATIADELTACEIEGRRQIRAALDIFRKTFPANRVALQALPSRIGIRESRHVRCLHQLSRDEILYGKKFEDAIANGSYRVDIHHQDKPGNTFLHLDGREFYSVPGRPTVEGRWRPVTAENPTYYQIPYRSLIPLGTPSNLLVAGRMIDAHSDAFGAIRVMVIMNQVGEAAGTAAFLALQNGCAAREVSPDALRHLLTEGGSVIL